MNANVRPDDGLFQKLHGRPAQMMIIAGLVLVMAAPLIPTFRIAAVNQAQADFNQIDALMELDMESLKRDHERERKEEQEDIQREMSAPIDYSDPDAVQKRDQENQKKADARQAKERERQKAMDSMTEELKKKYDALERKRAVLNSQRALAGMRWHRVIGFLGNVLLVLGLLVLTLESEGVKQKIALVILLVVMFSALSGVSLNFLAAGSMGEEGADMQRILRGGNP